MTYASDLAALLSVVREDFESHGRDATKPGFQALVVHRIGVWRMGIQQPMLRAPFSVMYRMLFRTIRNLYGIELPYSAHVGRRVVIEHQGGIVIHGNSTIGDDCTIRQNVTLGIRDRNKPTEAPVLAAGVDVGAGAVILGAVHVGEGAKIGANAVVIKDIPPHATAVGVPAVVAALKPRSAPKRVGKPKASK